MVWVIGERLCKSDCGVVYCEKVGVADTCLPLKGRTAIRYIL